MTEFIAAEKLILLSLDPTSGKQLLDRRFSDLAIAGALLADLAVHGKVAVKQKKVHVVDASSTGHRGLDEMLAAITSDGPRKAKRIVKRNQKIGRRFRDSTLASAVDTRDIKYSEHNRLLLFSVRRWTPVRGSSADHLGQHIAKVVAQSRTPLTADDAVVIAVMDAARVLKKRFDSIDKAQVKAAREAGWADDAVRDAIRDAMVATITAINASTAAAASSSG